MAHDIASLGSWKLREIIKWRAVERTSGVEATRRARRGVHANLAVLSEIS